MVIWSSAAVSSTALTIAVRYNAIRRQFPDPENPEKELCKLPIYVLSFVLIIDSHNQLCDPEDDPYAAFGNNLCLLH